MEVAKTKAEIVASKMSNEPAIPIMLVLTIIQIILSCIHLAYKCNKKTSEINNTIRNPTFVQKVILARVISKHCKGMDIDQRKLRREILNTEFTESELTSLIQESIEWESKNV